MHTTFHPTNRSTVLELVKFSTQLGSWLDQQEAVLFGTSLIPKQSYQTVVATFNPNLTSNPLNRTIGLFIFDLAYKAETMAAGSAWLTARLCTEYIKFLGPVLFGLSDSTHTLINKTDASLMSERFIEQLFNYVHPTPTRKPDLDFLLKNSVFQNNPQLYELFNKAMEAAGLSGTVSVEPGLFYSVETKFGYRFPVKTMVMLPKPSTDTGCCSSTKPTKVVCVDGVVETVSEIDRVLTHAAEGVSKFNLVMVAQGFSEEVIGTVLQNNLDNRFSCGLVQLEQTPENLNVIGDIAVVCNTEVVSPLKGDMLVYVDPNSLSLVDEIITTNTNELVVNNSRSTNLVSKHVNSIIQRINSGSNSFNDEHDQTTIQLLNKRLKSLLAHSVVIRLPCTPSRTTEHAVLDLALRTTRTAVSGRGLLENNNIDYVGLGNNKELASSLLFKPSVKFLRLVCDTPRPAVSVALALRVGSKGIVELLWNSGVVSPTNDGV